VGGLPLDKEFSKKKIGSRRGPQGPNTASTEPRQRQNRKRGSARKLGFREGGVGISIPRAKTSGGRGGLRVQSGGGATSHQEDEKLLYVKNGPDYV